MDERIKNFSFTQVDENDVAELVILNEPSMSNWMGSIHPNGSLYEFPVDIKAAKAEHDNFREELEKHGCVVMTVREILSKDCDTNVVARVQLEDLAFKCIRYVLVSDPRKAHIPLTKTDEYLLSDEYKRAAIDKMNTEQLVEVVLTNPTIYLQKSDKDTELLATNYTFKPLVNLVFTRDQQITTARGLVIASLSSTVRSPEVRVMKFCFEKMGIPIVGEVPDPGKLEGGDFFPGGRDICYIGVGLRSNMHAVNYLMKNDLFGTRRVAVVKDYFDSNQQRMHLDTVSNILGPRCMLMLETIMGENSPTRRLVDEYVKNDSGCYKLHRHDIEFSKFMREEGFKIIPVSEENQINYGCNGLNLGGGNIISVDKATAKLIARSPYFDGRMIVIDFRNMTNMYGSVHCCSQVVSRKPTVSCATDMATIAAMCSAAASNNVDAIRKLHYSSSADLNQVDYEQRTPLHVAATHGSVDVVRFLLSESVDVNLGDRWGATPLDDAYRANQKAIVQLLRENGAKTQKELQEANALAQQQNEITSSSVAMTPRPRQSTNKVVMLAPNNFDRNPETADDNPMMSDSDSLAHSLVDEAGPRVMREHLLKEFSQLHRLLTVDLGVEVFLFTHEAYENTPDATFVNDWFSTHSATDSGEPTYVLYPMRFASRRNERKEEVITLLSQLYPKCINLSANELLTANEKPISTATPAWNVWTPHEAVDLFSPSSALNTSIPDPFDGSSITQPPETITVDEGLPLEFGAIVLNRIHKIAYVNCSTRANPIMAAYWAERLGVKLITFRAFNSSGSPVHHTTHMMKIGTGFAIVCAEAIRDQSEREAVLSSLNETMDLVITISLEQMDRFCAQCVEVVDKNGAPCLIMSDCAFNSFTEDQRTALSGHVRIVHCDMSFTERLGGGSVVGLLAGLF